MAESEGTEGPPEQELTPEQREMLRQMEEEMRRVRVQDLIAQSVVSIINVTYRRIAKEDERDLEQARTGIEAVHGLLGVLDEDSQHEIRNALSQLQVLYAQHAGGAPAGEEAKPAPGTEPPGGASGGAGKPPPRLWTPGSD